ncbi:MAG TPA: hypothetical protein VIJ12_00070 [Candidatus Baltobacteraceae bacterium]
MNDPQEPNGTPRASFEWKAYVAGLLPGVFAGIIASNLAPLAALSAVERLAIVALGFAVGLGVQFLPLSDSPRVKFALAIFVVAFAIFWAKP